MTEAKRVAVANLTNDELLPMLESEMRDLTESGAGLPFVFSPAEAFALMGLLQLVLRHPALSGYPREYAQSLAENIQQRISVSPAIAEAARRGWRRA